MIRDCFATGYQKLRSDLQIQYEATKKNVICSTMRKTAEDVVYFVKNNWKRLLAYLVAWSLIIVIMGGMRGFTKVSKPLAIGLSIGIGFGLLTSIVAKGIYPTSAKSGWQIFRNTILRRLDAGTSTLFISITSALIVAGIPYLPKGIGIMAGTLMGNHLFTQIVMRDLSPGDPTLEQRMEKLEKEILRRKQDAG